MDMDRKYKSSSLFSIANHARIFSVQLAYGLSLQDVRHNLNIFMDDITNGFWGNYNKTENQISGFLCIFMYNEY